MAPRVFAIAVLAATYLVGKRASKLIKDFLHDRKFRRAMMLHYKERDLAARKVPTGPFVATDLRIPRQWNGPE